MNEFRTERLPLAIFLHATSRLRFVGCAANGGAKISFVFDDPAGIGSQMELEYERGALVAATALFASQKYLRRQMSDALNRKMGEPEHDHSKH